ncbi:MAG: hypothetical protein AB200_02655 [Parcubacteria bacterium C7867-005]|nr:MAG: hypothetical protein AB200_02655 [Parcubacteria bacterium C7867-005]
MYGRLPLLDREVAVDHHEHVIVDRDRLFRRTLLTRTEVQGRVVDVLPHVRGPDVVTGHGPDRLDRRTRELQRVPSLHEGEDEHGLAVVPNEEVRVGEAEALASQDSPDERNAHALHVLEDRLAGIDTSRTNSSDRRHTSVACGDRLVGVTPVDDLVRLALDLADARGNQALVGEGDLEQDVLLIGEIDADANLRCDARHGKSSLKE